MLTLNIFGALIFITSNHYAVGSLVDVVAKTLQTTYTDTKEDLQEETTKTKNDLNGIFCKENNPFRTMDGTCNNLKNPGWGAAGTAYGRFWKNSYSDGKGKLSSSCSDDCYRSAREMSVELYDNVDKIDPNITVNTMSLGQFFTHDVVRGRIGAQVTCCENGKYTSSQKTHPKCDAIGVSKDDPVYGPVGIECQNFVRGDTNGCKPASPISAVTGYIDGSQIYGNSDEEARSLRTGRGGKMISAKRDGKMWLPQSLNPTEACFNVTSPDEPCYRAGDTRVNQNTMLTVMHIIFLRFHNYVAEKLCGKAQSCRKCDDEKCFQHARRIVIAVFQKIVYEDYLTLVLGRKYMYKHGLIYEKSSRDKDGYVDDYSCDCNPSMTVECASAAFRGQHSAIPGHFNLYFEEENCKNKKRCDDHYFDVTGSIELSDWINKPSIIEKGDNSIGLSRCLFAQPQEDVDTNFVDDIRIFLFKFGSQYGIDLCAFDIERGRDHGVPTYCDAAIECGVLTKCNCFDDIRKHISAENCDRLEKLYCGNVSKVELMVGGMLEKKVCGTLTGPVFRCILRKQFLKTRRGDRYWYESKNQPYRFSPEELENIRQTTIGSLICQHGDGIDKIQKNALKKISKTNPLMNCCDVPKLDLSLFQNCEDWSS